MSDSKGKRKRIHVCIDPFNKGCKSPANDITGCTGFTKFDRRYCTACDWKANGKVRLGYKREPYVSEPTIRITTHRTNNSELRKAEEKAGTSAMRALEFFIQIREMERKFNVTADKAIKAFHQLKETEKKFNLKVGRAFTVCSKTIQLETRHNVTIDEAYRLFLEAKKYANTISPPTSARGKKHDMNQFSEILTSKLPTSKTLSRKKLNKKTLKKPRKVMICPPVSVKAPRIIETKTN